MKMDESSNTPVSTSTKCGTNKEMETNDAESVQNDDKHLYATVNDDMEQFQRYIHVHVYVCSKCLKQ